MISMVITKVEQGLQATIMPVICYDCLRVREEVDLAQRLNYEAKKIFITPHIGDPYRPGRSYSYSFSYFYFI